MPNLRDETLARATFEQETSRQESQRSLGSATTTSLGKPQKNISPLDKFTLFPKLPLELWCRIFFNLPGQRVVAVTLWKCKGEYIGTSPAKVPAALHICSDARKEAMRFYKLIFGCKPANEHPRKLPDEKWFDNMVGQQAKVWTATLKAKTSS